MCIRDRGDDVDLDFLASGFEMSGSQIKNSILGAAFLAAGEDSETVSMGYILRSVRKELAKSGKKPVSYTHLHVPFSGRISLIIRPRKVIIRQ